MGNLESFGVSEMSYSEAQEIDGGIAPLIVYGAIFVVGVGVGIWAAHELSD